MSRNDLYVDVPILKDYIRESPHVNAHAQPTLTLLKLPTISGILTLATLPEEMMMTRKIPSYDSGRLLEDMKGSPTVKWLLGAGMMSS